MDVATVAPPKVRDASFGLQQRLVEVQIHAVDALDLEIDMIR
jgi:hypothetical protein